MIGELIEEWVKRFGNKIFLRFKDQNIPYDEYLFISRTSNFKYNVTLLMANTLYLVGR